MVIITLSTEQFQRFSVYVRDAFGIRLTVDKLPQLDIKLAKLLVQYSLESPEAYYRLLMAGSLNHIRSLAEELTVHKTDFFREKHHFDFLTENAALLTKLTRQVSQTGEFKAWSAGCSTGEEAYTMAMVLREALPPTTNLRVLATDISGKVLAQAQRGVYPLSVAQAIPPQYGGSYYHDGSESLNISETIKRIITFRGFNLMKPFPFRGRFDVIFCRNVMIYFDSATQEALVNKFYEALAPGGYLFIGHSESLSNLKTPFRFVKPTIYVRS